MSGFCYDVGILHDVEPNIFPRPSYSVNMYKIYIWTLNRLILRILQSKKGGKFLKKLWCCVGGRVEQGNSVLSTDLIT